MRIKMPRGATPTPRSELAAAEPYTTGDEVCGPGGTFPSPNHELAAAPPYQASGETPESFLAWPLTLSAWANDSRWAEESFAKACADPKIFIPPSLVQRTALACGSSNFAAFMQTHGFQMAGKAYLDGPFKAVDWTNTASLQHAIANAGPVKIGITLAAGPLGASGWAIHGRPAGQAEDECASLCGYGSLATLLDLFEEQGVYIRLPLGMPTRPSYAMFARGSIGIIDQQSLVNITGEAWVRNPVTIVKNLSTTA